MSIRTRYALFAGALVVAVLTMTAGSLLQMQRRILAAQERARIDVMIEGVERLAREAVLGQDQLMLLSYLRVLQREHPELAYAAVTWAGHTAQLGEQSPGLVFFSREVAGSRGAGPSATLRLGLDSQILEERERQSRRPLIQATLALAGIFIIVGVLGAVYIARLVTLPLVRLAAAATAVGKGNLKVVLPVDGTDETARLSARFNHMTANLQALNQFKADIMHTLTHELNTPLMGLRGHLELLQGGIGDSRAALATMLTAVMRMEESLSNALRLFSAQDHARRAGKLELVQVHALMQETCALFAPVAQTRKIVLVPPDPSMVGSLMSDKELLRQIVTNLVSNAIKYTPEGGRVSMGVTTASQHVTLWVSDSGAGIPRDKLNHLFKKFDRAAGGAAIANVPGTGLGLSIVQQATQSLNGKVSVRSEDGKGATFLVSLPRMQPATPSAPAA